MRSAISLLSFSSLALASWTQNLNYRSPSDHHPGLGISLHKVNKRNVPGTQYTASQLNFTHGVASGDPYSDSVILWTRVAPMFDSVNDNSTVSGYVPLYSHGANLTASTAPVCVQFKVSKSSNFSHVESSGTVYTSSDVDYTVKVRRTVFQSLSRGLILVRPGRGQEPDCLHSLLLPIQRLRLQQDQSPWSHQDRP